MSLSAIYRFVIDRNTVIEIMCSVPLPWLLNVVPCAAYLLKTRSYLVHCSNFYLLFIFSIIRSLPRSTMPHHNITNQFENIFYNPTHQMLISGLGDAPYLKERWFEHIYELAYITVKCWGWTIVLISCPSIFLAQKALESK